jgi:hypothetical protein
VEGALCCGGLSRADDRECLERHADELEGQAAKLELPLPPVQPLVTYDQQQKTEDPGSDKGDS